MTTLDRLIERLWEFKTKHGGDMPVVYQGAPCGIKNDFRHLVNIDTMYYDTEDREELDEVEAIEILNEGRDVPIRKVICLWPD